MSQQSKSINMRLKEARKLLGYNQETFAKGIGISRAHVSNMENGNDNPSPSVVKLICMKYNINENWLLNGDGNPTPDYNILTADGAFAKYEDVRVGFEQKLQIRKGKDLQNTIKSFANLSALLDTGMLNDEDASNYLNSVVMAIEVFEKLTFKVSAKGTHPSKNNAQSWLKFIAECNERVEEITQHIKDAANIHLACYGEEMKLK